MCSFSMNENRGSNFHLMNVGDLFQSATKYYIEQDVMSAKHRVGGGHSIEATNLLNCGLVRNKN